MSRKIDRKRAQMKKQRRHQQEIQERSRQQSQRVAQRREREKREREEEKRRQEERRRQAYRKKKMQAKKEAQRNAQLQKKAEIRAMKQEKKEQERIEKRSRNRIRRMRWKKATRVLRKALKIGFCGALVIGCLFALIYFGFELKSVQMNGNEIYSQQELKEYIFRDGKNKNTFLFWLQAKTGIGKKEIPFIEKYEVKMKSPSKLSFHVYEKSLVGYIEKDGMLLYFDREGIIEKITNEKIKGIPKVIGIEIHNAKLYESLEVEDENVFDLLLSVSQTVQKYDFNIKKIEVTKELETAIYMKKVKVDFGKGKNLNEKMNDLNDMIQSGLLKYKGTVSMRELSVDGSGYTLKKEQPMETNTETNPNETSNSQENLSADEGNFEDGVAE